MSNPLGRILRALLPVRLPPLSPVEPVRLEPGSWLAGALPLPDLRAADRARLRRIARLAAATERLGPRPLWAGYRDLSTYPAEVGADAHRSAAEVSSTAGVGGRFVQLVRARQPQIVVEFGTAFGLSGLYWLAGLEANGQGHLYTFEPNAVWLAIAQDNLARLSRRFTAVAGTFEDNLGVLDAAGAPIDLAFIDAIHTPDFVQPQLELILARSRPGTLILLDDLGFSEDMRGCWDALKGQTRFAAALEFGGIGLLEAA